MGEASPNDVYRESKTVADMLKLVKDIPMYPSSPYLVSTDADIAALPPFTEALARSLIFLKHGGILNSDAWNQRYSALAPLLADVARSILDDIALVGLAGNVMRMTQRREEMARIFATRLVSWHEVVQMLADTIAGCPSISNQQLLLARRRAANDSRIAALEADLEDLEDEAEALEYFRGEKSAAASSSDQLSADED
ncbi:hypothetical protein CYMTET_15387 [Cymbomonas tetramitiformis]|uniref:Uncharacterized protein n=1 Tax=Cymbomonas tetramitiformis TaxID=36881 RepID=A0AAE0GEP3_9CHLO|nr:hypothetical protein CYMTET_15387 [Cymbomonas tetramitiformis]